MHLAEYSMEMKIRLGRIANEVHSAVAVDNGDFLESAVEGETIVAHISSATLMSLLRSADDFIACIEVAAAAMLRKDNP